MTKKELWVKIHNRAIKENITINDMIDMAWDEQQRKIDIAVKALETIQGLVKDVLTPGNHIAYKVDEVAGDTLKEIEE